MPRGLPAKISSAPANEPFGGTCPAGHGWHGWEARITRGTLLGASLAIGAGGFALFFRYGALLTVLTGLSIAFHNGYGAQALTFGGVGADGVNLIGLGMWLALIMAANVWFIIWPAQQKILGLVSATDEQKAAAAPRALIASRTNVLLSLPMFYAMVSANLVA